MKNSQKKAYINQSCRVDGLLGDISSLSFFVKSSELAGIYTSLASSSLKTAERPLTIEECQQQFVNGVAVSSKKLDGYSKTLGVSGIGLADLWTQTLVNAFVSIIESRTEQRGRVLAAAKSSGQISRTIEFLYAVASKTETGMQSDDKDRQRAIKTLITFVNKEKISHMSHSLHSLFDVTMGSLATILNTDKSTLFSLIGGFSALSAFLSGYSTVLKPQLISYLISLAPNVAEYVDMVNRNAEKPVNIIYEFSQLYIGLSELASKGGAGNSLKLRLNPVGDEDGLQNSDEESQDDGGLKIRTNAPLDLEAISTGRLIISEEAQSNPTPGVQPAKIRTAPGAPPLKMKTPPITPEVSPETTLTTPQMASDFIRDFQPVALNETIISNMAQYWLQESLTSSVDDPSALFDDSGEEPDYDVASEIVMRRLQDFGVNKFAKMYMAVALGYSLGQSFSD